MEKQTSPAYEAAMDKITEGENIINDCLDAMKDKTPPPHLEVTAYIKALRSVTSALEKLTNKRQRR